MGKANWQRLIGNTFGRLTAVSYAGKTKQGHALIECGCECGNICVVDAQNLKAGRSTSCGCKRDESIGNINRTHGQSSTSLYGVWQSMIQRCINPNNKRYSSYGGRGITVCDMWRNSFEAFRVDMGECPPGHSLDRIDNDGNYDPDNCRWATPPIQNRNQRSNKLLTYNGVTKTITDWAKDLGLNRSSLYGRLEAGWPIERAVTEHKTR